MRREFRRNYLIYRADNEPNSVPAAESAEIPCIFPA
jgi:hypothetical protein